MQRADNEDRSSDYDKAITAHALCLAPRAVAQ